MTLIEARIADEDQAGTDCSVSLELRNQGTEEACKTNVLDSPGNSWARGGREAFYYDLFYSSRPPPGYFGDCADFQPKENLQFRFTFYAPVIFKWTCYDHMKLTKFDVYFGRRVFHWSGAYWFSRNIDWMDFDSESTCADCLKQ